MRIALFCHSVRSDWNHGNAHFLRGVATELMARGHDVTVYEPKLGWSASHLVAEHGTMALDGFRRFCPGLDVRLYHLKTIDLDRALGGVDLVLVHEWTAPQLVARIGRWRARTPGARALFHDTHHRSATSPDELAAFDLRGYDGVLAFGECIRRRYVERGWAARAWTWHEAADTRVFRPLETTRIRDVVWIGNWGDGERSREIETFLIGPVERLRARALVHGVRYPPEAVCRLADAGIEYGGWLPNYLVPRAFAESRVTVHIPRQPYVCALPGIPTIRPFEALACGIPLVSAPWDDVEGLFRPGVDYLVARTGAEMEAHLRLLCHDAGAAREIAAAGLATIRARHTCAHRVSALLAIAEALGLSCRTPTMEVST